jgi:LytS/YehU family sensor histidine kinase
MISNLTIAILVLILVLILILIFIGYQLNEVSKLNKQFQKQNKKLENENIKIRADNSKLIADNAIFEINQLKFQLQPHALLGLLGNIKRISNRLNRGLDSLTETLEYILYKGNNNHLVSVKDEIKFIEDYLDLNELFVSQVNNVKRDFEKVDASSDYYSSPCIPHLITAYFIENAFKHGDKNHKDFLRVTVKLTNTDFELKIENQINSNIEIKKGGLGLKNMNKRLELLLCGRYRLDSYVMDQRYYSNLKIQLG